MYDYQYERDILQSLRLMKYLHQQDPSALEKLLKQENGFGEETIMVMAEYIIWEVLSDVVMSYDDECEEMEIGEFSHPAIYRFCRLSCEWGSFQGYSTGAWQRKLSDMVEFCLTKRYSVYHVKCISYGASARLKVWFSLDCYDPLEFGNAVIDLLCWLEKESDFLEKKLKEAQYEKEAA